MKTWWKEKQDADLFKALLKLPKLPFYRSVRRDTAKLRSMRKRFFSSGKLPEFHYSRAKRFDTEAYEKALRGFEKKIDRSDSGETITKLYRDKIAELRTRKTVIEAVDNKDDERVTALSAELFGRPIQSADELRKEFKEMLEHAGAFSVHTERVDAKQLKKMIKRVLAHYDIKNWRVAFSRRSSISIGHGLGKRAPVIRIPKTFSASLARTRRVLAHEIEVHVLRTENGRNGPLAILKRGLDRYIAADEGLAMHYQMQLSKTGYTHAPGFWDAWAAVLTQGHNFVETFNTLKEAKTQIAQAVGKDEPEQRGKDAAWRLCLRVYRGISDLKKPGVGFLRDHIYRSGYLSVEQALREQGEEILPLLFTGNIGLHHLDAIKKLDLPAGRMPELISPKIVKEVRREVRRKKKAAK